MQPLPADMKITEQTLAYRVQRLNGDNIAGLEQLHSAVYGARPAPNFFSNKYNTAFTGVQHVGFIAYNDEDLPIAFYAVIPCFIRVNGKNTLAAQSADTMTHPDYRFKGLFADLANRTFDLCETLGIRLLFGFPNQNSLPGFVNRLGWQMTERMDCFRIQVAIFPWHKLLSKVPFGAKILQTRRQKVLENVVVKGGKMPDSISDSEYGGINRDRDFHQYKTYNQSQVIRIGDSVLWIKINHVLLIGDAEVKAEEFNGMMHRLKKLAAKLGINEIQFHGSPGTVLHRLFSIYYIPVPSFPVIFKNLGAGLNLEKIKFTSADVDTF